MRLALVPLAVAGLAASARDGSAVPGRPPAGAGALRLREPSAIRAHSPVIPHARRGAVQSICEILRTGVGAGPGQEAVANLVGIGPDGLAEQGRAAYRVIVAAGGGAEETSSAVGAGGTTGYLFSNLTIHTACGLALGTIDVGYNVDSGPGRAFEAWRKVLVGEGLSTEQWSKLWNDVPLSASSNQAVAGEIQPAVDKKRPAAKLESSRREYCAPDYSCSDDGGCQDQPDCTRKALENNVANIGCAATSMSTNRCWVSVPECNAIAGCSPRRVQGEGPSAKAPEPAKATKTEQAQAPQACDCFNPWIYPGTTECGKRCRAEFFIRSLFAGTGTGRYC